MLRSISAAGGRQRPSRPYRRGVALLLAMIAVIVAATLAYSYLASQGTSIGIARNIRDAAPARYLAETGLELASRYIEAHSDWRTLQPNGVWALNQSYGSGTFTIRVEDGTDLNGNGAIDAGEGDGSLSDSASDPATITVTGKVGNTTQVVRAIVRSSGGGGGGGSSDIGYTTPFPDWLNGLADIQIATEVALTDAGELTSISVYTSGAAASRKFRVAVYSDAGSRPGSLIVQTAATAVGSPAAGWRTAELSSPITLEAGSYWLAFCFEHTDSRIYYSLSPGNTHVMIWDAVSNGFISNWSWLSLPVSLRVNIRATISTGETTIDWIG